MYIKGKENSYKLTGSLILRDPDTMHAMLADADETLEEILEDFTGLENITVTDDDGKTIDIFSGFGKATNISLEKGTDIGDVVTVTLQKPDRIDALEDAVDMLTLAILGEEGE